MSLRTAFGVAVLGLAIGLVLSVFVWPPRARMLPPRFVLCDCSRGIVINGPAGLTCGCDESTRSTF